MSPLICNGWTVFFYPLFNEQWVELLNNVQRLKSKLELKDFVTHSDVKLLKAVNIGIKEKIPQDPFASHFALKKPLQKYARLKKMGLPERYRLFFRAFKKQKVIIILWLGFPRKEGDKKDCYQVFYKKLYSGELPEDINTLIAECKAEAFEEESNE